MRSILLAASVILCASLARAQVYEIGLNAGVSTTTKPHKTLYKGNENVYNYAADLNFKYSLTERWQLGASVGVTKWQREDEWPLTSTQNLSLGEQKVNLVLAQSAASFLLQFNHVIPFYEQYEDFVRSSLYFGIATGAVVIGNDGRVDYSRVNPNTPAEYTYASTYHFEAGYGYALGFQIGYNYYFSDRVGVNLDIAPRVNWVRTNDARIAGANSQYNVWNIPATIGFHYRFGFDR